MIADLFELQKEAEDESLALDGFHLLVGEHFSELIDELGVDGGLTFGEAAEGFGFDLVGQVSDDAAVRFHAAQDVGLHKFAQWCKTSAAFGTAFHRIGKGGGTAEQAGIEKVEEAP